MNKKLLSVTPKSQLFPIPMIMGCEGVSAAMLLQYNHHNIKATDIMKHWPTHPNNPYKGYVYLLSLVITKRFSLLLMFHIYKHLIHVS